MKVIYRDKIVDRSDVQIDIEDRAYQFGDGIYEAVCFYQGKLFTFDEHIDRLFRSAEKLEIHIPYSREKFRELLEELIVKNNASSGIIYLQVSRGTQPPRSHIYDEDLECVLTGSLVEKERDTNHIYNGEKAIVLPDERWLNCDIKTLNLLGNILAKKKASRLGAYEAILARDGIVTECSHSNVHIIKDGVFITHQADNLVLHGITRKVILEIVQQLGIPIEERDYTVEELKAADEVIISSVVSEATPILQIDDKQIGNGKRGPITAKIQTAYEKRIEKECGITL